MISKDGEKQFETKKINWEEAHDILEVSEIKNELDLSNSIIYKLLHPTLGLLILIQSSGLDNAVVYLS